MSEQTTTEKLTFPPRHRWEALMAFRRLTQDSLARKIGCCPAHLGGALAGRRPFSQKLLRRIRGAVGEDAWRWAAGESDYLPEPQAKPEQAPAAQER